MNIKFAEIQAHVCESILLTAQLGEACEEAQDFEVIDSIAGLCKRNLAISLTGCKGSLPVFPNTLLQLPDTQHLLCPSHQKESRLCRLEGQGL